MFKMLIHSVGIDSGVSWRLLRTHTRPVDKFITLTEPLEFPVGNNVMALNVLAFMLLSDTPCAAWTNCLKAKGRSRLNTGRIPVKSCLGLTPDPFDGDDFGIEFVT